MVENILIMAAENLFFSFLQDRGYVNICEKSLIVSIVPVSHLRV